MFRSCVCLISKIFKLSNYASNFLGLVYCLVTQNVGHFAIFEQLLKILYCYGFSAPLNLSSVDYGHYQKSFKYFELNLVVVTIFLEKVLHVHVCKVIRM